MPNQPKTYARSFRLGDEVTALLDQLGEQLGGLDRTAVLRLAVRRLADAEGIDPKEVAPKKKKSEKSA